MEKQLSDHQLKLAFISLLSTPSVIIESFDITNETEVNTLHSDGYSTHSYTGRQTVLLTLFKPPKKKKVKKEKEKEYEDQTPLTFTILYQNGNIVGSFQGGILCYTIPKPEPRRNLKSWCVKENEQISFLEGADVNSAFAITMYPHKKDKGIYSGDIWIEVYQLTGSGMLIREAIL